MALYKRNSVWWVSISHNGQRIQRSTGTENKVAAQEYHDKLKAELWSLAKLNNKPVYSWRDAVLRWLRESGHKRSIEDDKSHLRWLDKFLSGYQLHEITRDVLEDVAEKKAATGVSPTTVNRMMEVVRAILRKAHAEWEWLDKVPVIRMRAEPKKRIRWLTPTQANRLIDELPKHLKDVVGFSLATGLRKANVTGLKWQDIDLDRGHAWVHPDEAKANKAIPVPLNQTAMDILKRCKGAHPTYVFTYCGNPIQQCNTKAWKKALNRAGIKDFRWHDLRHTWASWHVQNGTSLQELQQLGGWSTFDMVLRYAHLSSEHLKSAANRVNLLGVA